MGSPILSDDGVGLFIAGKLKDRIEGVDALATNLVGLDLLEIMRGYDRIFLIDALTTRNGTVGELKKLTLETGTLHLFTSHGLNFSEILELGNRLGIEMPDVGAVYGIEIGDEVAFGEEFSDVISEKIDSIIEEITEDIKKLVNSA